MPENTERWATWIDRDLMQALRVLAAVTGKSQRQISEEALRSYLAANPVDAATIAQTMDRAAKAE